MLLSTFLQQVLFGRDSKISDKKLGKFITYTETEQDGSTRRVFFSSSDGIISSLEKRISALEKELTNLKSKKK